MNHFFCEYLHQIPLSHLFVEEPYCSYDTDELTDATEVVSWGVFNGKRRLQVKRSGRVLRPKRRL